MYPDGTANSYYRAMVPLRELERRGHRVLWPALGEDDARLRGTPGFDVLLLHHRCSERELELVRRLAQQGVAVVWDNDDAIAEMPRRTPTYRKNGGRKGVNRIFALSVEIAKAASLMTTPSRHLASRYRDLGVQHVEVIENYVAPEHVGRPRPRHQGVVIGITAAQEHADDFKKLKLGRVLRRLLRAHQGVRVMTIGCSQDLPIARHVHRSFVQIEDLVAAESTFDIGLAPLVDTPFNRARSNVKLKEYASAGAMWLASPVGPYVGMGVAEGGALVADDQWYAAIERNVLDPQSRRQLADRACAWAGRQTADLAAGRWEAALAGAVARMNAR